MSNGGCNLIACRAHVVVSCFGYRDVPFRYRSGDEGQFSGLKF